MTNLQRYRLLKDSPLVERGMRQIVKWKRRLRSRSPIVEWQFLVFDHNLKAIPKAKEMAREIGVDRLCFKYDAGAHQRNWRAIDKFKYNSIRRIHLKSCLWLWGSLIIDTDGIVVPCCNAARTERIGDLEIT